MRTSIMAVDPGLGGAVALFIPQGEMIAVYDMPVVDGDVDAASLAAIVRSWRPETSLVERVASRPGQGVSSMFKFGTGYGIVRGVLAAVGIPTVLVSSTKWKRYFALDADKEKSRALALRTWPGRSELFARKKDHGRAEAALLAYYGHKEGL